METFMQDPITTHSYVQVNESFVHLTQYSYRHENIITTPPRNTTTTSSSTSSTTPSPSKSNRNSSASFSTISNTANITQSLTSTNTTTSSSSSVASPSSSSSFYYPAASSPPSTWTQYQSIPSQHHDPTNIKLTYIPSNIRSQPSSPSSNQRQNNFNSSTTSSGRQTTSTSTGTTSIFAKPCPPADKKPYKKIIVFVPGNPGLLGIYHDFLVSLLKNLYSSNHLMSPQKNRSQHPLILAIGHNNFDHPNHVDYKALERISVQESDLNFVERAISKNHSDDPHHMELQVINKLIVLKKLLKYDVDDCKFIFIGHSIGCYVILKLLQDKQINAAHLGSILIHPALENLALTPRGSRVNTMFNYRIDLIGRTIAYIADICLPKFVKLAITKWFCDDKFVKLSSDVAIESVTQLICHKTFTALIEMAKSEFALVKNINPQTMVKPHESKLRLIYAINDGWVNEQGKKLLRDSCPNLSMEEEPNLHAFVMDPETVIEYAAKGSRYIQDFLLEARKF